MNCDDSSRLRISITFAKMQQDVLSIEAIGPMAGHYSNDKHAV